jgi:hypothetical protein
MSPAGGCRRAIRGRHAPYPSQLLHKSKQIRHNISAIPPVNTMRQEWGEVIDKYLLLYFTQRFWQWLTE